MRSKLKYDIMVATIFHDLGHLLGAKNDRRGIMQSNLHRKGLKSFSAKSAYEIAKCIDEDAGPWCVSREVAIRGFSKKRKWFHTRFISRGITLTLGRGNMTRMSHIRKNGIVMFLFRYVPPVLQFQLVYMRRIPL